MTTSDFNLFSRLQHHRRAIVCVICTIAVLVAAVFLLSVFCRVPENVSIGGLDVGGRNLLEAHKTLKTATMESLQSRDLTVELPRETLALSPKDTRVNIHTLNAIYAACREGRGEGTEANTPKDISLLPYLSVDEDFIQTALQDYASQYDSSLSEFHYELDGNIPDLSAAGYDPEVSCPVLKLTLGTPEAHLDVSSAFAQILEAYALAFSADGEDAYCVSIEVTPEALPQSVDLDAIYEAVCVAAVDASLDMQTYEEVPGTYGCAFDLDAAKRAVTEADWGETLSFPMEYMEPQILGDEVYFRDVLGSCETKHTDDENRNTNLRLVCEILDGLVIQPGEEFSYNGTIGERTEERGFKPAGAYSGNRLVKDIGGGVCQGSTTLYNCVLLADLEVTERVCHGLTVNYVPIGLDAAVNWATKTDFKFRNNFHFPIMIRAEVSDGYMKMKILGTDEKDYYIEMKSGRSDEELRIYSNSYKYKYDKETGELISKDLEARSSYMYYTG